MHCQAVPFGPAETKTTSNGCRSPGNGVSMATLNDSASLGSVSEVALQKEPRGKTILNCNYSCAISNERIGKDVLLSFVRLSVCVSETERERESRKSAVMPLPIVHHQPEELILTD